jgi:hypothetical protein
MCKTLADQEWRDGHISHNLGVFLLTMQCSIAIFRILIIYQQSVWLVEVTFWWLRMSCVQHTLQLCLLHNNQNDRTSHKQPRTFTSTGRQQKALQGGKDAILAKSLQMKVDITIGLLLQKYRPATHPEWTNNPPAPQHEGWMVGGS